MAVVLTVAFSPQTRDIAFLWHNLIGAVVVFVVGMAISAFEPAPAGARAPAAGSRAEIPSLLTASSQLQPGYESSSSAAGSIRMDTVRGDGEWTILSSTCKSHNP